MSTRKERILIVLHCLDMTGAVIAAYNLAKVLKEEGYCVFAWSESDGFMKSEFEKQGIHVVINEEFGDLCYDIAFVNTLLMGDVLDRVNRDNAKLFWWLHESPSYFLVNEDKYDREFWQTISDSITIVSAGVFVHDFILNRYGRDSVVLNIAVEDVKDTQVLDVNNVASEERFTFLCAASAYIPIKGQDILALAIANLPQEYWDKCEFFFAADENAGKLELFEMVLLAAKLCKNVQPFGLLEHDSLMQLMKQSDCVIIPSREDATNTCAVEAMSMSKICICSDMAGITKYISDKENGYIFHSEDIQMLVEKIMYVVDKNEKQESLRKHARMTYEKYFSYNAFRQELMKIIEGK